jgi:hypothetical protein
MLAMTGLKAALAMMCWTVVMVMMFWWVEKVMTR